MSLAIIIVFVILLLVLFPVAANSFTRKALAAAEPFHGVPWYNYTITGDGTPGGTFNSIMIDMQRELVFLTHRGNTRVEKIHSIVGGSFDDRSSPYTFPTTTSYTMTFGPDLETLKIHKQNCGIMQVQINDETPMVFYIRESSAKKYPSTDVTFETFTGNGSVSGGNVANPSFGRWYRHTVQESSCAVKPCTPMILMEEVDIGPKSITMTGGGETKTYEVSDIGVVANDHRFSTQNGMITVRHFTPFLVEISSDRMAPARYYRSASLARQNTQKLDSTGELIGFSATRGLEQAMRQDNLSRPPVYPLSPPRGSASALTAREISTLS